MKKKILVLCTANSCRSQIAHGYLDHFGKNKVEVFSAGVDAQGVNPRAIQTMKEDGIDISHHKANHVNEYINTKFDYVITVCESAKETCPYVPATIKNLHQDFPDPAIVKGTEEQIMNAFQHTRELIKSYMRDFVNRELN